MTEERIVAKIEKLLERAAHQNTPEPERLLCLQRANELMISYKIEQATLDAGRSESDRRKPVHEQVNLFASAEGGLDWDYRSHFRSLFTALAKLNGVRVTNLYDFGGQVDLVGYAEDVTWTHLMYMQAFGDYLTRMFPVWDRETDFDQNVRAFKDAGYSWQQIWAAASEAGDEARLPNYGQKPKTVGEKDFYRRAYRRACKVAGVTPDMTSFKLAAWRLSYTDGFTARLQERIWHMEQARTVQTQAAGAELVLFDAKARVDEMFFALFPDEAPETEAERAERVERWKQEQEKIEARRVEMLAKMSPSRRAAFLAAEERKAERDRLRWDREWDQRQATRYDTAGEASGRRSADQVDLSRSERVSEPRTRAIG